MTKEDLIRELSARQPNMTKKDITSVVDEFFVVIAEALKRGEEVQLDDFGTFLLGDD
jgi:nucleoid DNA-binding protein